VSREEIDEEFQRRLREAEKRRKRSGSLKGQKDTGEAWWFCCCCCWC
jgi:hypothetical protein